MADDVRHDQSGKPDEHWAPDKEQQEQQGNSARRRDHSSDQPALTKREREERWPIG